MLFKETIDTSNNCPQCGDKLQQHFKYSKLIKCQSCGSTIFLEDKSVKLIGERSTLSPEPSLIQLHSPFTYQKRSYLPIGKIRYSYGRGFWEEWFLKDEQNQEFWLSIDEGDFVLEEKMQLILSLKNKKSFKIGQRYNDYIVTEIGEGTCVGFEGELPEPIALNEKHRYIHLSRGEGELITIEVVQGVKQLFKGKWIDPLEIKVLMS